MQKVQDTATTTNGHLSTPQAPLKRAIIAAPDARGSRGAAILLKEAEVQVLTATAVPHVKVAYSRLIKIRR